MELCSVIVPAFNAEATIGDAIRSALAQTYPALEVIVVNDGSTDHTAEALDAFAGRIDYLEQANAGPAAARNRALERASGRYVALLDADDIWLPDRLRKIVGLLESDPSIGFATSDAYVQYGDEPSANTYYRDVLMRPFAHDDQTRQILRYDFIFVMAVIRAELFERHGTFEETLLGTEDWDLWVRFLLGGERAGLVDEPLAYYRIDAGGLSGSRNYDRTLPIFERALPAVAALGWRGFGDIYLRRAREAFAFGDVRRARIFFQGAAQDPSLSVRARLVARASGVAPGLAERLRAQRNRSNPPRT